ncbi:MAG: hypothetical protein ACFE9W_12015 [Promethearchaeota archaeon]
MKGTILIMVGEADQTIKNEVSRSRIKRDDEPVHLILAAAKAGFSLFELKFQPYIRGDDSIMAGFLTALTSISNALFSQPLESARIGEYNLQICIRLPFLFCYVSKGEQYPANQKLNDFIEKFHAATHLWNSLTNTIETGAVDRTALSSIENMASQALLSFREAG